MSAQTRIESFVQAVRGRLNRFRFLDTLIWSLGIGGAVLLIVCLVYVFRGYAVPKPWYAIAGGAIALGTLLAWAIRRWSQEGAAHFTDRFFGLKDTIVSYRHFKLLGKSGNFYDLQEAATVHQVEDLAAEKVRYQKPKRLLAVSLLLVLTAGLLAFKQPAPEILEKLRLEEETLTKTGEINEHLEELIEELEESTDEEEKELLDPDKLRELVKDLKNTEDRKEALRQYAELERKLQEATQRLDQRKSEQILARAGEELQKDQETEALGEKLEDKKFREAAKDLEDLKPEKLDPNKLSEQRKELAKLKSAAQRMASAARAASRTGASSQNSGSKNSQSNSAANASASKGGSGNASGENSEGGSSSGKLGKELEDLLSQLDESVKKLENALKNAELEKLQLGEISEASLGDCQNCEAGVLGDLDKLNGKLCKLALNRDAQAKLLAMCKGLGQCQGFLCNGKKAGLKQCLSASAGGKKAGVGSVESRRDGTEELVDNGQFSQLKGQKGEGPGQSTVEAADSGDGVSSRQATDRKREFQRQLESFVQREDVPDDVKEGVKEYFKSIHQQGEPAAGNEGGSAGENP